MKNNFLFSTLDILLFLICSVFFAVGIWVKSPDWISPLFILLGIEGSLISLFYLIRSQKKDSEEQASQKREIKLNRLLKLSRKQQERQLKTLENLRQLRSRFQNLRDFNKNLQQKFFTYLDDEPIYPLISVIIHFDGKKADLKEMLDGMLLQSYPQFELIILNAQDKQEVKDALIYYARFPQLRIFQLMPGEKDFDVFAETRGDLITFQEVGAHSHEHRLSIQAEVLRQHDDLMASLVNEKLVKGNTSHVQPAVSCFMFRKSILKGKTPKFKDGQGAYAWFLKHYSNDRLQLHETSLSFRKIAEGEA